ncbi:hypothetical protein PSH77_15260 [Pseudomonas extremorientalis]|uniref:hypothetical protein n=1 Tax=Pseudomonas extremorientalis TaxID=169669 RepID=UPI00273396B9|nr:hypothetical protein [Pseudomonas extremorientalis]WLG54053.1 hypothetical protein PSH77_15260 [Pseudomonas extremorientalis]
MSQIKERPILFSAPMVRAILEGRKTVTRRAVKGSGLVWLDNFLAEYVADPENNLCPYGNPGDRLWVRETFIDLRGTGVEHRPDPDGPLQRYAYAADCRPGSHSDEARKDFGLKYKPSIHMPHAACRILLEITDVRVERLQDISEQQALAEGIVGVPFRPDDGWPVCTGFMVGPHDGKTGLETTAAKAFAGLWNSVGGNWDANSWVWVVEFKRV